MDAHERRGDRPFQFEPPTGQPVTVFSLSTSHPSATRLLLETPFPTTPFPGFGCNMDMGELELQSCLAADVASFRRLFTAPLLSMLNLGAQTNQQRRCLSRFPMSSYLTKPKPRSAGSLQGPRPVTVGSRRCGDPIQGADTRHCAGRFAAHSRCRFCVGAWRAVAFPAKSDASFCMHSSVSAQIAYDSSTFVSPASPARPPAEPAPPRPNPKAGRPQACRCCGFLKFDQMLVPSRTVRAGHGSARHWLETGSRLRGFLICCGLLLLGLQEQPAQEPRHQCRLMPVPHRRSVSRFQPSPLPDLAEAVGLACIFQRRGRT
ncbi:hypothetical protein QBC34DRAFT_169926 [Podospora aff. communis PSN243]|uniref:Uncharacterized protein n=1 Tax=Podospora aff. communis PSN243 TaxID=3040156 RepID=A0AAV9GAJ7_9PEZI|nr:hypothetical protein QBC34DRAFT_169926 [Podospora aff. communis PSN243]